MTLSDMLSRASSDAESGAQATGRRGGRVLAGFGRRQRPRVLGVIFLCLMLLAVWFTYAVFSKQFSEYDEVKLETARVGLQLPQRADVKVRGVIVGEVLDQKATADGAEITLGIHPEETATIPSDVTGAILPKTLFGQKYVSLVVPDQPSATAIAAGDVIEKTHVAVEVQSVLNDIYPLLRTIDPADLNNTLNAVASALEGRGEELGRTIETLDGYLKKLNPEIPLLIDDLRKASKVSDMYTDVLPQVARILRDGISITGTFQDHEAEVAQLLTDVRSFARVGDDFLADNEQNLIQLGKVAAPVAKTLGRYSPEFPCLLGGLNELGGRLAEAFRNYTLHIDLELLPRQPRAYTASDAPRYDEDRGPACGHLPSPPWSQQNPLSVVPDLDDGVDAPTGKGTMRAPSAIDGGYASGVSYVGTPAERKVLNSLMGPGMGMTAEDVPDLGALMIGPMARGAKVGLQ